MPFEKNLLSICCVGYNHAQFIEANIHAVEQSAHDGIELILVDDGSSDGSRKVLQKVKESCRYPVRLILQEHTGNPAQNYNRAIREARGRFITLISLDDILNMAEIDRYVDSMRKNKALAFITATNFDEIDINGKITGHRILPIDQMENPTAADMLEAEYSKFESFWLQGTVFRKEIVDAVGGFDEDMLADDIVLRTKVLRYMLANPEYSFRLETGPAFFYRLHGNNISSNLPRQLRNVGLYLDRYWTEKESPAIYYYWLSCAARTSPVDAFKKLFIQDERLLAALSQPSIMNPFMQRLKKTAKKRVPFQLFFDEGKGFSEENSITIYYDVEYQNLIRFTLPYSNVKRMRLDPADFSVGLQIDCIKAISENNEFIVDLKKLNSNAEMRSDFLFVFRNDDPNIVIDIEKNIEFHEIEIQFKLIDEKDCLYEIIGNKQEQLQQVQEQLQRYQRWKKVFPKKLRRAARIFRDKGFSGMWYFARERLLLKRKWKRRHGFSLSPLAFGVCKTVYKKQCRELFSQKIKFSILVPLYNTQKDFLQEMIASVLFQSYADWELCLADGSDESHSYVQDLCEEIARKDCRVKYRKLETNGGISMNTNACISMATGDYISLLDHDDLLHPSALFWTMKAICEKDADFVYTDEATFKSPELHTIIYTNFKPDFSPEYLHGLNYITHFTSFKRELLRQVGDFDPVCDGAQDYDMILRLTEKASCIVHIPKCLYYWRATPQSTAGNVQAKDYTTVAGKRALEKHFERRGEKASVSIGKLPNSYKIDYPIIGLPLVSILIPSSDHAQTLERCINSIRQLSTYKNYEIIIIENNSKETATFRYYDSLKYDEHIKIVTWQGVFNYSVINNYGFIYANGDYVLLLNNDIEVITPEWIEEMLMFAQRDGVGAVGAMLYYPANKIQHAGVILGIGGVAGHSHKYFQRGSYGYVKRLLVAQNLSAVTAACLLVSSKIYREINGFDEGFAVAFNDVDLCMRIRKKGYRIVWTPFAELYHYESETRGYEDTPEKQQRFSGEVERFQNRWGKELREGDPYYNPNLTLSSENFALNENAVFYQ